ncbi:MAG: GNAT family N-acetyltransferase [Anaerolineaceae bacterium]|nr:MAG: GNAT family N-acetyltransferase [Anaerolineaceae bacterium]
MTLRRAQPEHAEALTRIALAAKRHWNYPEDWIELWTPQLTISPAYIAQNETWLAVVNDEPVAFYSLKQDGDAWWLDHLWVTPEAMGQHLGAFLFRHALSRCRRMDASILMIESDPNAVGFYEKMGARKVDERRGQVDGQPRILPILQMNL